METLYKSNCVEIIFDEHKKMLTQNWNGSLTRFSFFKQAIDKTVQYFQLYHIEKLLFNSAVEQSIDKEGTNYTTANVAILVENGMKKMAFVTTQNEENKMGVIKSLSATHNGFIKQFNNPEAAQEWLFE